jgi:[acyl-carrier-protein] S-malonyltransferase
MDQNVPFIGAVMKVIACTPNRNFDNDNYQKHVIEPTRQLRKFAEELGDKNPTSEQKRWVFNLLNDILTAKQIDKDEQAERLQELANKYEIHT